MCYTAQWNNRPSTTSQISAGVWHSSVVFSAPAVLSIYRVEEELKIILDLPNHWLCPVIALSAVVCVLIYTSYYTRIRMCKNKNGNTHWYNTLCSALDIAMETYVLDIANKASYCCVQVVHRAWCWHICRHLLLWHIPSTDYQGGEVWPGDPLAKNFPYMYYTPQKVNLMQCNP